MEIQIIIIYNITFKFANNVESTVIERIKLFFNNCLLLCTKQFLKYIEIKILGTYVNSYFFITKEIEKLYTNAIFQNSFIGF